MIFTPRKKYRILMEGTNLVMDLHGIGRFGFVATRYVRAADSEKACALALDLVRKELAGSGALMNEKNNPFSATVLAVTVLASLKGIEVPGEGFTFFAEQFQPEARPVASGRPAERQYDRTH